MLANLRNITLTRNIVLIMEVGDVCVAPRQNFSDLLLYFAEQHRVILHLLFEADVLQHIFLHFLHGNVEQILTQLGGDEDVSHVPRLAGSSTVDNLQAENNEVLQRVQLILVSSVEE